MDSRSKKYAVVSPAKLNLGLEITGRRADGYHLLQSLFWPISLADEIELEPSDAFRVETPGVEEKENLVFKAFEKASPFLENKWSAKINKRIPMGGGLGGGSSNAGSVLKFLSENSPKLLLKREEIARSLGADVSFFLNPTPSWVTGIGEKRKPIQIEKSLHDLKFVLLSPDFGTSTPLVYKKFKDLGLPFCKEREFPEKISEDFLFSYLSTTTNSLEQAACEVNPQLAPILEVLRSLELPFAGMSGSGATCFGVFRTPQEDEKIVKVLSQFCRTYRCHKLMAKTYIAT